MLDMAMDTFKIALANKLFLNPTMAYGLMALGAIVAAAVVIIGAFAGLPLWLSGAIAGFVGGLVMPYLFKDIKFK